MANASTLIGLGMPAELASAVADGVVATNLTVAGTVTPTGKVIATGGGVQTLMSIANVNDTTPTAAELIAAFGAAATTGNGFMGVVKDANADTNCFLVLSNGTSYFYLKFTKAV